MKSNIFRMLSDFLIITMFFPKNLNTFGNNETIFWDKWKIDLKRLRLRLNNSKSSLHQKGLSWEMSTSAQDIASTSCLVSALTSIPDSPDMPCGDFSQGGVHNLNPKRRIFYQRRFPSIENRRIPRLKTLPDESWLITQDGTLPFGLLCVT